MVHIKLKNKMYLKLFLKTADFLQDKCNLPNWWIAGSKYLLNNQKSLGVMFEKTVQKRIPQEPQKRGLKRNMVLNEK